MAKVGRPEILQESMAKQICRIIARMPDAQIPVNWKNVIAQVKKVHNKTFTRAMLSQKMWNGRKLIAEAYSEAKEVQKRMQNDSAPKYKTAGRAVLQKRIAVLEAKYLASQEELEKVRAEKIDMLDIFLNSRCDLNKLLSQRTKELS